MYHFKINKSELKFNFKNIFQLSFCLCIFIKGTFYSYISIKKI